MSPNFYWNVGKKEPIAKRDYCMSIFWVDWQHLSIQQYGEQKYFSLNYQDSCEQKLVGKSTVLPTI